KNARLVLIAAGAEHPELDLDLLVDRGACGGGLGELPEDADKLFRDGPRLAFPDLASLDLRDADDLRAGAGDEDLVGAEEFGDRENLLLDLHAQLLARQAHDHVAGDALQDSDPDRGREHA